MADASSPNDPLELNEAELDEELIDRKLQKTLRLSTRRSSTTDFAVPPVAVKVSELEYWSALGDIRKVKLALVRGADINARGENGYTALHAAAENGHLEVITLLISQGADLHAQLESGQTALDLAVLGNLDDVVDLLKSL